MRWRSSSNCNRARRACQPAELAILLTALGEREQASASLEDGDTAPAILSCSTWGWSPGTQSVALGSALCRTWCDASVSRDDLTAGRLKP